MAYILLVEDEDNARLVLTLGLRSKGHTVESCGTLLAAKQELDAKQFEIVLTDLRLHGENGGLDVVRYARQTQQNTRILLVTAYASAETAVEAMREGAFDYLTKPVSGEELSMAVEHALNDLIKEIKTTTSTKGTDTDQYTATDEEEVYGLLGHSNAMQRVRDRLHRAAKHEFTVLLSGESGTGKELAALFVHKSSNRAKQAFIPVHCGAIPAELFEDELFGHQRGAFTGAQAERCGLIEAADKGTLFLDEIGEMPLTFQVKLLRVLQERKVRRIGSEQEKAVDIRIVAATNRDLAAEVQAGRFREDLFYRLNVIPVYMPPLRQRMEDLDLLVPHLLTINQASQRQVTEKLLKHLKRMSFPGNVRQLGNLMQRLLAMSDADVLDEDDLQELQEFSTNGSARTNLTIDTLAVSAMLVQPSLDDMSRRKMNLDEWLMWAERCLIDDALNHTPDCQMKSAAKILGVSYRSMRYRVQKLGIAIE
ncbi:MAG: sigma-54 dependent transcriptional regulator [Mariprofundales bacterium]